MIMTIYTVRFQNSEGAVRILWIYSTACNGELIAMEFMEAEKRIVLYYVYDSGLEK